MRQATFFLYTLLVYGQNTQLLGLFQPLTIKNLFSKFLTKISLLSISFLPFIPPGSSARTRKCCFLAFTSPHSQKSFIFWICSFVFNFLDMNRICTLNNLSCFRHLDEAQVICSEADLRAALIQRNQDVVSILSDNPSDLKILEDMLKGPLSEDNTEMIVYCPFAPFNHTYEIIEEFFEEVEDGWTGNSPFCVNFCAHNCVPGVLLSLPCLVDSLKFDHVIYYPGAESDPEKVASLSNLALQDFFLLDQGFVSTTEDER